MDFIVRLSVSYKKAKDTLQYAKIDILQGAIFIYQRLPYNL